MTTTRVAGLLLLLGAAPAALGAQTSLTIYNDGRVLVRRTRAGGGAEGHQHPARGARRARSRLALLARLRRSRIGGLAYDGAVDEGSVLRRSVGRRVVFRLPESKDTMSALVLGVDPLRLQLPDGSVTFSPPGAALYPGDVVVADPTATLRLSSAKAQDQLRLGYFTTGAAWQASYQVVLGASDARVTGSAVIESQTLRAEDAELQLLAGAVGQAQPSAPPVPYAGRGVMAEAMAMDKMACDRAAGRRVPPLLAARAAPRSCRA